MRLSGLKASPKPQKGVEDKDYVDWLSRCPSVTDGRMDQHEFIGGVEFRTDGHHIHTKGARGGDYWRIPLTRKHHNLCHAKGNKFVEDKYNLDFHKIVCRLLRSKFGMDIPDKEDWEMSAKAMVKEAEKRFRDGQ